MGSGLWSDEFSGRGLDEAASCELSAPPYARGTSLYIPLRWDEAGLLAAAEDEGGWLSPVLQRVTSLKQIAAADLPSLLAQSLPYEMQVRGRARIGVSRARVWVRVGVGVGVGDGDGDGV